MKSLIYLEMVKEINFSYQKEFVSEVKQHLPEVTTFDLDNYSDPQLISLGIDLIKSSSHCVIVLKADPDASPGKLMGIIEEIIANKQRCISLLYGRNPMVEKISKQLGQVLWIQELDNLSSVIIPLLKSGGNSERA